MYAIGLIDFCLGPPDVSFQVEKLGLQDAFRSTSLTASTCSFFEPVDTFAPAKSKVFVGRGETGSKVSGRETSRNLFFSTW